MDPRWPEGELPTAGTTQRQRVTTLPVSRIELRVELENGEHRSHELAFEGDVFRIGSHPGNEIVLSDPLVSRFHCSVSRSEGGWTLADTGSLNGTFVQGLRVRDVDLPTTHCTLELGHSRLRLRPLVARSVERIPDWTSFGDLRGESVPMRRLFATLSRVADSDATVLLEGESGTGKELAATEIVRRGKRARAPFVIVDCGAIAPALVQSELFGHTKGAFTGADAPRVGAFEAAHGGTVFLDEVGELPVEIQPLLLRALETRQVRRVGENAMRTVDVRVIAATNRRLEKEVNRGRFREDLFFRLSVVTVRLPPLRERLEDVPLLVEGIVRSLGAEGSMTLFTREVLADLERHDWPGNVRELRNYVERAVVLDRVLPALRQRSAPPPVAGAETCQEVPDLDVPFRIAKERAVDAFEQRYFAALIAWAGGNVSKAARRACMDRMHLHRLLQRHGLRDGGVED